MVNYRDVQNFTPRRDIVLGNKSPMIMEIPGKTSVPFVTNTNIEGKQSLVSKLHLRFHPLLAIILVWFIIPALRNQKNKNPKKFTSNFRQNFNNPKTILNMLSDVSPYLDLQEQENIQTLIGIFEAANILNSIRAGTYQSPRILKNISLSANAQDRTLGIIKAVKPYLPSNNHEIIDKAIHTYNAISKVSQSLTNYSLRASENVQTQNNIDKINELLEVITPVLPNKQKQMLNQIRKMIKMYAAMESSQLWEKWSQQNQKQIEIQKATNDNETDKSDKKEHISSDSKKEKKNITEALNSVLGSEQSQAMEFIMKMAQLLSQKSTNKEK